MWATFTPFTAHTESMFDLRVQQSEKGGGGGGGREKVGLTLDAKSLHAICETALSSLSLHCYDVSVDLYVS